jgi:hypothetical protein
MRLKKHPKSTYFFPPMLRYTLSNRTSTFKKDQAERGMALFNLVLFLIKRVTKASLRINAETALTHDPRSLGFADNTR